jgi:hypothetical protein
MINHNTETLKDFLDMWDKGYRFIKDSDVTFTNKMQEITGRYEVFTLEWMLKSNQNFTLNDEPLRKDIIRQAFHYLQFLNSVAEKEKES